MIQVNETTLRHISVFVRWEKVLFLKKTPGIFFETSPWIFAWYPFFQHITTYWVIFSPKVPTRTMWSRFYILQVAKFLGHKTLNTKISTSPLPARCGVPNIKWVDASYDTPCSGPESYGMYHGQVFYIWLFLHSCFLCIFDATMDRWKHKLLRHLLERYKTIEINDGLNISQPCLIVKLNRVFGWEPEPYYNVTEVFFCRFP